jgi:hypothetical protein
MLYPSHLFSSLYCQGLVHRKSRISRRGFLLRIATHHLSHQQRHHCLFAFNQPSSRLAASWVCALAHYFLLEGKIMGFRNAKGRGRPWMLGLVLLSLFASTASAQGPAPETAPPLFPGGGLISYHSIFTTRGLISSLSGDIPLTARPTFSHEGDFNFTWGVRRDFDVTVLVPVVTNHFEMPNANGNPVSGGTGLGDAMVLVKYRFYRRDSKRGTTQASVTLGPKFPTGRTDLADMSGKWLPASLQPGSGSTDFFVEANWTYTGLFHLRRLVADEAFHSLSRAAGTQKSRLGSDVESRFWISYRPYESKNGAREWFIGPVVTWLHSQDDRIAAVTQSGSGGNLLLAGITTYVGVRPGTHVWLGMDWDVVHSASAMFMPVRRHISFGVTRQFRLHFK